MKKNGFSWLKFIFTFAVVAGAWPAGSQFFVNHYANRYFTDQREFDLTYSAEIHPPSLKTDNLRAWIPLAGARDGQEILKRTITSNMSYRITHDPVFENDMIYLEAKGGRDKPVRVQIDYRVREGKAKFLAAQKEQNLEIYLRSSRLMPVTDEVVSRMRLATQHKTTLREKAHGIYDYVIGHMVYDKKTPGWGQGDTLRACRLGKGNCTDFHSLFISMTQAAAIPARFKIGFTIPKIGAGALSGYHCWAEFYEPGKGWQPIDASEAWKHPRRKEGYFADFDANKFLISVGRDVTLVPPASKGQVNIFFYPHAEVNGKRWTKIDTSFYFRNLK